MLRLDSTRERMQAERDMQPNRARRMPVGDGQFDYLDERMQMQKVNTARPGLACGPSNKSAPHPNWYP
jgi:hypothetical protein